MSEHNHALFCTTQRSPAPRTGHLPLAEPSVTEPPNSALATRTEFGQIGGEILWPQQWQRVLCD